MVLSPEDRDDLVTRVEQKLGRVLVRREVIRDAVDRTLGALATRQSQAVLHLSTVVVSAESMPDLASRLRAELARAGFEPATLGAAAEGRHTVVTLEVSAEQVTIVRSAAEALNARVMVVGGEG